MSELDALLNVPDPAWPELKLAIERSKNGAEPLPLAEGTGDATLLALKVSARSTLGALAHETGGVSVDRGWLRLLGGSGPRMQNGILEWNGFGGHNLLAGALIVAFDAAGGLFAANGGGLAAAPGNVLYFAPDRLEWEDLGAGHTAFVHWALEGDLAAFYEGLRWPGWEQAVAEAGLDRTFGAYPPPWTAEGKDPAAVDHRPLPALELAAVNFSVRRQIGPA